MGRMNNLVEKLCSGYALSFTEAEEIAANMPLAELCVVADDLRKSIHRNAFDLCSIINAKSGKCSENCKFCAQSSHYSTAVETYDHIDEHEALALAKENESYGVHRFSLVTAGRSVSTENLKVFSLIYHKLAETTKLSLCASMGFLTTEKAEILKKSGVSRYHCNLEASRSYFPQVCTTHTWDEKVDTIKIAQSAGMDICSGGIIGMGETRQQRLELAFELREIGVLSIPINILNPITSTPFAGMPGLDAEEILRTIAMFRLINPKAVIRMAGGRGILANRQDKCFTSGANGAIVGNFLTTIGQNLEQDLAMFRRLGFAIPTSSLN